MLNMIIIMTIVETLKKLMLSILIFDTHYLFLHIAVFSVWNTDPDN